MSEATTVTQPVQVQVDSVENELAGMWRSAVGGRAPSVDTPVAKVIFSNLLIYSADHTQAESIMDAVADVIADHPARVIVADAQDTHGQGQAGVSIVCGISERGRRLCGEEIRLHTQGEGGEVLGTLLPMLVPDLPVSLLTPGDLVLERDVLRSLTHICDSWTIDSRGFERWSDGFELVGCLWAERTPPVAIHDLAWVSLDGWRESVAQHFDPRPARDYISGIREIEIGYKQIGDARPGIQSVLMAAWLMSRLSLRQPKVAAESGGWRVLTTFEDRPVSVRLRPVSTSSVPAIETSVQEVVIECEVEGRRATFRSKCQADEIVIEATAPDLPAVRRVIRLGEQSMQRDILRVVSAPGRDRSYEDALPVVRDLARQMLHE